MAKKREGQRQAAYEAGTRNVLPGQGWVEALGRGLLGELYGSDMGTPVGQKLREELGSVGYENVLRELYPEDYAMGRAAGSDFVDPLTLLAMRGRGRIPAYTGEVMPPVRPMAPMRGPAAGPIVEGRATGPGLQPPPVRAIEDMSVRRGPYREVPIAPQTSGFERGAVAAKQRNARGFGYGYEAPGYFEEGGQGFRPTIDDYVDVNVVRNPQEYYNQSLQDHLAAQMRAGNRGVMRHEMYGPNGDRPAFGVGGEGKGYFGNLPNPGVNRGPRMERGPAPFGEAPEGNGGFANMPRPGVRYDGRTEMGQGAGAPRLRYEPVQQGMVPYAGGGGVRAPGSPTGYGIGGGGGNLPTMAGGGGRGMVPRELQGEFYEVPGIGYAGGSGAGGGVARGGAGVPLATLVGGGIAAGLPGAMDFGGTEVERRRRLLPDMVVGMANNPLQQGVGAFDFGVMPGPEGMETVNGMKGAPVREKKAGKRTEAPVREIPLTPKQPANMGQQQGGWEPNFNYLVTQAIDRALGMGEAERGRRYQQDVEAYQRKYGPIYY